MFDDAVLGETVYGAHVLGSIETGVSETVIATQWTDQCVAQNLWFDQAQAISSTVRCNDGS